MAPERYYYDGMPQNTFGWSPGTVAFYAYGQEQPGTTAIYCHRWKSMGTGDPDRYYYDDQPKNNYNWADGLVFFYAYKSAVPGTVPIYRYIGKETYYYYTASPQVSGKTQQLIAFYAYPPDFLGIIGEIERTLARKPDNNKDVTYVRTSGTFRLLATPPSDQLLEQISTVIGSASQVLDMTFMYNPDPNPFVSAFPDGKFQQAISDGFQTLIRSRRTPTIRILFGVPLGGFWRSKSVTVPAHTELMGLEKDWLSRTITLGNRCKLSDMKCPILLAHGKSASWNHTKIIVADDKIAITGGHNFYAGSYLGKTPVYDVSGVFEGPAARAARVFCDKLWTQTAGRFTLINGAFGGEFPSRQLPNNIGTPGSLKMLALGRLGKGLANFSASSNASVTARIVALCTAKQKIRISQQSLRGIFPGPPLYDVATCLAIVRAVRDGVNVEIILSGSKTTPTGYEGSPRHVISCLKLFYILDNWEPKAFTNSVLNALSERFHKIPPRTEIDAWVDLAAGAHPTLNEITISTAGYRFPAVRHGGVPPGEFTSRLSLASLYSSDTSAAANHAKVYIIDNDCFYVGSDNMYVSAHKEGLQEFGYLIEDQSETEKFISDYWNKLWPYSEKNRLF
ncbi:MAG TPA: hypothetical protein VFM05_07230, partial [Candidatus Saccharimonadales bacterium]|nr:hypothetical protein [Candidatus Saccharimonadales bacterium]